MTEAELVKLMEPWHGEYNHITAPSWRSSKEAINRLAKALREAWAENALLADRLREAEEHLPC